MKYPFKSIVENGQYIGRTDKNVLLIGRSMGWGALDWYLSFEIIQASMKV
jgi:hypothetical protein